MKLPRDLSGADVVRALEKMGFQLIRQTGSHIRLTRGATYVTVPNHPAVAAGTLRNILRQAGVSLEEFQRQL